MQIQSNPYIIWQIISTLITLGIFLYIETRPKKKPKTRLLSLLMLGGTVWSLANIIQWLSPEFDWQARWNTVVYIGILIVPTAWLLFSIKYTSIGTGFSKKIGLGFWIMPVLIYIAVISNDFHQLFYISQKIININDFAIIKSRYGPVFYIHTAYSYILVFSGMVICNPKF